MAWEQLLGNSAGQMNSDGSRKLLLHSTEGTNIEGAFGAYRKNNSWPTLTVDCRKRRVVRHLPDNVAARSLRNKAGGVETNRDGTILIQIELMGFAGAPESIGTRDDLVWLGTEVVGPLCRRNRIPIESSVRWAPYPASYGENATQRLSPVQWDGYSGILGHQHAPENTHGDPGAIDIATILSAARGEHDDMNEAQEAKLDRVGANVIQIEEAVTALTTKVGEIDQHVSTVDKALARFRDDEDAATVKAGVEAVVRRIVAEELAAAQPEPPVTP